MGSITGLNNADYMALARAMDTNGNNRIDKNEANIDYRTHNKIGNQNGVVGTREFADALSNGDVFLTSVGEATAEKFADYFSKRNENFDKPVAQWISDAWVSKDDFEFSADNKRTIDQNNDNRVSRKELVSALVSGHLAIGKSRQVSQDPFTQPQRPAPATGNPFNNNDPFNNDPFTQPQRPVNNNHFNNDPFDRPQHSEVGLKLQLLESMSSDYSKGQLLQELAKSKDLNAYDQEMIATAASRHVSDNYTLNNVLTQLARRSDLSEPGAIKVLKVARELDDYSKGNLVKEIASNHRLSPSAQRSAIITAGTLDSDYSIGQALLTIVRKQPLEYAEKELMVQTLNEKISSDYSRNQVIQELF